MEVERRGQHHPLPQDHQPVEQAGGDVTQETVPHLELPADVPHLLHDDEAVEGEEEAVAGDVSPSPHVASTPAAILAQVLAHLTVSYNI